jgi:DinB superfamily
MPAPLAALARIVSVRDADPGEVAGVQRPVQFVIYDLLRQEQAVAAGAQPPGRRELDRILDLAQSAFGEFVGVLVGRRDELLDSTHDGDWSMRDVLRHAIAVELRYGAQVEYSATRGDEEPLVIPAERLPCNRLAPPEPEFGRTRAAGIAEILRSLGDARRSTDARLAGVPDSALDRPSRWGTVELTVRMRSHQIGVHLIESVIQAEKCLGAEGASESRRILRRAAAVRGAHERWSSSAVRATLDELYQRLAVTLSART